MMGEMYCSEQIDDAQLPDEHCSGQMFEKIGCLDDVNFDIVSALHSSDEETKDLLDIESETLDIVEPKKENVHTFPSASFQLLTDYGNRFKRLNGEKIIIPSYETDRNNMAGQKLSTDAIIRLAGQKFIQPPTSSGKELFKLSHTFGNKLSGLFEEENRDVELVFYLLASAEKVGEKQFNEARNFLQKCHKQSSCEGDPVQRLVYYFSRALHEKIDRETGKTTLNLRKKDLLNVEEGMMTPNATVLEFFKAVPFCNITQVAGIQAMVEDVAEARKIHIIDLAIRNGMQFTILMQALATRYECPVELLKITAIGTTSKLKIEETGGRLTSFARSMNLPFSFHIVMVEDIMDLNESLLSLDSDEVVTVYSGYFLRTLIGQPDRLDSLMKVIRNINPLLMIVTEVEANHNSPVFVNRFIETLFYFGAFFDCLEDCMKHVESHRRFQESFYFSEGIHNIVAVEGEERTIRHVKIDVWRAFFARFRMVDMELSMSSMYQANMVLKKFSCSSSYTLEMDGKCLTIGWKGTPLHSLSAWKFT